MERGIVLLLLLLDRPLPTDYLSFRVIMTLIVNYHPYPFLCLVFVNRMRNCLCPITTDIMQRLTSQIIILLTVPEARLPEQIEIQTK